MYFSSFSESLKMRNKRCSTTENHGCRKESMGQYVRKIDTEDSAQALKNTEIYWSLAVRWCKFISIYMIFPVQGIMTNKKIKYIVVSLVLCTAL